jgi:hypothetical protein
MTQATDSDIKELKDLILGLDKKIDDTRADIRVMDVRLTSIENRLISLENRFTGLDNRLSGFGALILTSALAVIGKVFFFSNP